MHQGCSAVVFWGPCSIGSLFSPVWPPQISLHYCQTVPVHYVPPHAPSHHTHTPSPFNQACIIYSGRPTQTNRTAFQTGLKSNPRWNQVRGPLRNQNRRDSGVFRNIICWLWSKGFPKRPGWPWPRSLEVPSAATCWHPLGDVTTRESQG